MKKLIIVLAAAVSLAACGTLPKVDTSNRIPVNTIMERGSIF